MTTLLVVFHIIICVALIMIVLLQTGKGADMGAAFGGGGSNTLFGSGGASTFLSKLTTAAAIAFMLTSFWLAFISSDRTGESLVLDQKPAVETKAETSAPEGTTTSDSATVPPAEATPSDTEPKN